jgi:MFS family permease
MIATLSFVVFGLVLFSYPPISKYVIFDLNLSNTESGSITSVFVLAYALMQVPGGYFADRFGGAKTLLIFTAVIGVSPFIFIIGHNFVMALVFRALAGGACGVTFPSAVRVLSSWFSENEIDSAMSVFTITNFSSRLEAAPYLYCVVFYSRNGVSRLSCTMVSAD